MEEIYCPSDEHNESFSHMPVYIRKPTVMQAGLLYLVVMLLFLFFGSRVQRFNFQLGVLITEFVLILLPTVIFLYIYRFDAVKILRLNRISLTNLLLALLIIIFAIPLVGVMNFANLWLIKSVFGKVLISQPPISTSTSGLIINILVIGGAAGICEEILFRGTIQRCFERFGAVRSILLTSFLFGLMHIDFQKLLGTFLLGALIGFIVYRTDSIFGGMLAHFANNSAAVILSYLSYRMIERMGAYSKNMKGFDGQGNVNNLDLSSLMNMPRMQLIIVITVWALIIAFCVLAFCALCLAFVRNTSKTVPSGETETEPKDVSTILWLFPGVLVVLFLYFAQVLKFTGKSIYWVDVLLKFIGLR